MNLEELERRAIGDIEHAATVEALEAARVKYVGRNGELTLLFKSLKDMPLAERRAVGPEAMRIRTALEAALRAKKEEFDESRAERRFFDVTKPGKKVGRGHVHPLTLVDLEVRRIFASMNFSVIEGPEVETERYNFDALNIPEGHPARDMWDTFWLKGPDSKLSSYGGSPEGRQIAKGKNHKPFALGQKLLMRTHTSPMQIRYMETHTPPFQIIVPGRVFRYEATDASHEINFYQFEGLMVGSDVTLANFKFIIEEFFKKLYGPKLAFRFRPSYFPFVEPGLEVDIKLPGGRWLEVMGAGMVHRNVFDAVRYDPDDVQGFAFGAGLDRLAMIKYGIPDIRLLYSGDLRFTNQF